MDIRMALKGPALVAMALATLVIACSRDHPLPSPTGPTSPITPTSPTAPSITVELSGPAQLAPGDSAQYTLIVHSSDLVSRTPTDVRWIAAPPGMLQVDASGRVTGVGAGGGNVTAEMTIDGPGGGKKWALLEVLVVPTGTFRIAGLITDSEFAGAPVPGALVEVTPGGLVATTGPDGFYRLYGVPADAEFRVTAVGYEPRVQRFEFSSHTTQNIQLTLSNPRLNFSGPYTLAVDAVGSCQGSFPAELQHRSYTATLKQSGLTLDVALTEPRFRLDASGRGNHFSARVDPGGISFYLASYPWDWGDTTYPNVAEQLADGRVLVVDGSTVMTGSAAGLSGSLSGVFTILDSAFPAFSSRMLGTCDAARISLTPR
jgi:hypothetical protein